MRESRPGGLGAKTNALQSDWIFLVEQERRSKGQNGTYLSELLAQPGGPEGRSITTAGSWPILVHDRPRGVRPCSPRMDLSSSHLVPSLVSISRTHCGPAAQGLIGPVRSRREVEGFCFHHARYDELERLISASTTAGGNWGLTWSYDGFGNRLSQNVSQGMSDRTHPLQFRPVTWFTVIWNQDWA
jgi:YD repeat-containing protein